MKAGLLDIKDDERRNTYAAFATLFAITTGHTVLETARDAIFLAKIPASRLPWMNLIIVAAALGLAKLGSKKAKTDSKGGVTAALVFGALVTSVFWFVLPKSGAPSPNALYALYVWSGLFASWAMVQFWTLLGRIHTMTQAKRLYGFIGAGAVLGAVIGAVFARFAMAMFAPRTSLLVAAVTFAVATLPTLAIVVPDLPRAEAPPSSEKPTMPMSAGFGLLWQNPFARRVLAIGLVSVLTVGIGDYLFKSRIAAESTDPAHLGAQLSTFYAITNSLSLVAQLFVAPWLFRAQGVQRALFLFPALLMGAAATVLVTGGNLFSAVGVKVVDGVLRYSVHKTTMELLLVPVPDLTRERIKPITELIGTRGGQALASILILGLVAVSAANPLVLGAIVLLCATLWLALVVTIRSLYIDVFRETLRSGGLSGKAELPELDLGALETIFAGLNSTSDTTVLASLDLLAEQRRERLIPALILYHPSRDVVVRALEIFTQHKRTDFVPVADRLNNHPDREVAAAALRARTAVMPDRGILLERLEDECPQVSVTALTALMARDWITEEEAERHIDRFRAARSLKVAAELARAIRDVAPFSDGKRGRFDDRFDDLLVRFGEMLAAKTELSAEEERTIGVSDDENLMPDFYATQSLEIVVRLEVARAMEARRSPRFVPVLVGMLARHELRHTARSALLAIPDTLDALTDALADVSLPHAVRFHIPRTIALFEPAEAAKRLVARLGEETDGGVRFKILRALIKLRGREPRLPLDEAILASTAEKTMDHVAVLRDWRAALAAHAPPEVETQGELRAAAHHLLYDLLRDKETHATQRLFLLLQLIHREDFDDIWRGLRSKNAKTRASSVELIENILRPPLRQRVLALVAEAPAPSKLASYEAVLQEVLAKGGTTLRMIAEVRATELDIPFTERRSMSGRVRDPSRSLMDRARDLIPAVPGASRAPA